MDLNDAVWSAWNKGDERTEHILFAEFNTTGSGINGASRAKFATMLNASQASSYSISSVVGSDFGSWVDSTYLV